MPLPFKKIAMLAALAAASIQFAPAQQKVAVIKLQEGLLATAELKKAQAELQAKYKPRQDALERLQREMEAISARLNNQAEVAKLNQAGVTDLQTQGQRKQREAQRIQEDLEQDFNRDRQDILARSGQRFGDIVKKVAEEKGFDVVMDINNTIYFKPVLDITNDVVAAYDKAYPAK
ncbi:MAG: OmpH family outer membrane protein [Acidobacteria bacterium]|nr:OmpH family outer membrane protein [Acidobacteriota bacterium]